MNLIFMGTPEFAVPVLQHLTSSGHAVLAVVTQPDRPVGRKQVVTAPPVKVFAIDHEIPVLQPQKLRTSEARAPLEPIFKQADAIIVAAYGRILPDWILSAPRQGCLNVHSSLLPKYRGAAPIHWAIANGEVETGVSTMQMDAGLDTGPILLQRTTPISETEDAGALTLRLAAMGAELMVETLRSLERGTLSPVPQDDTQATYAPILKREDGLVDWHRTSKQILDRKRGFTPFPGCYTLAASRRLEVVAAEDMTERKVSGELGEVVEIGKTYFLVQCGDETQLRVTEVQPEGRRIMQVREYLNGAGLTLGTRLG